MSKIEYSQNRKTPEVRDGIKRRGLLRLGTLATAISGVSALSVGANTAKAAGHPVPMAPPQPEKDLSSTYVDYARMNNPAIEPISFDQFPVAASGLEQFNTATIAQDVITSAPNGDIYAVYWDSAREPRIAVKNVDLGTWTTSSLAVAADNALAYPVVIDSHNNIVIAVDGDGYIHISGNHHGQALRYIRSINPFDITAWERGDMVGADEDKVTYPQFIRKPNGDLLFFYRNGVSGNGDTYVNTYSRASRSWSRTVQLFKGTAPVSPDQCAYINRVAQHSDGVLHVFFMWRESTELTNTDLSYIRSADGGKTWTTVTGTPLALPIVPTNTLPRILAGNPGGLINQSGATVDSNGIPHTFFWMNGGASKRLNHFYWSGTKWEQVTVAESGAGISRATGYSTSDGKTYAVFKRLGQPTALRVYPTVGNEVCLYGFRQASWEPTYDSYAPPNTMRLMLTPADAANKAYASTYAGILTVDMAKVDALPASRVVIAPRSVSVPEDNKPGPGLPAISGRYYRPNGATTITDRALPDGEFRGAYYTFADACAINTLAVDVLGRAGGAGLSKFIISTPDGKVLYVSTPISTATVGVKNVSIQFRVGKGQTIIILAGTQGSTSPGFRWLEGTMDNRVAAGSTTTALQTSFAGVSTKIPAGPTPPTLAMNGTSFVPLIAVGIF
ncbi:hypothetical protein F8G81_18225 [Arthrobacter sp. CDRTa11]|uniref:BNR repeat-containing protein n=1 Tax=Arthrobacter sp. CDRTa11 TaxID=2651199 RepID=UPI00226587B7|nr:BNR repeat-containing protein [Arthrobacter sp. CDRTa11]UZX04333.1 hypothetical protein F8G81_18225 [Arthrobacter sp. CDRTa11]